MPPVYCGSKSTERDTIGDNRIERCAIPIVGDQRVGRGLAVFPRGAGAGSDRQRTGQMPVSLGKRRVTLIADILISSRSVVVHRQTVEGVCQQVATATDAAVGIDGASRVLYCPGVANQAPASLPHARRYSASLVALKKNSPA